MNRLNYHPSTRQLRQFSVCAGFMSVVVGWAWFANQPILLAACIAVASVFIAITWLFPGIVKPIFIASQIVTRPIGWVVGEFALLLIYVFVIVPLGIYFRIAGKGILSQQSRSTKTTGTYWKAKATPPTVASYYRQF